jgi:hypothetical protein
VKNQNEKIKTAIWVCCGLIVGMLIMFAVQHFSANEAKEGVKEAEISGSSEPTASIQNEPNNNTGTTSANPPAMQACPYPVSSALATLNGPPNHANAPQAQQVGVVDANGMLPGTVLSESSSGYPVYTGGRAIDSPPVLFEGSNSIDAEAATQRVGRNGLLANPCSDPPSAHGLAYGRTY